MFPDGLVLDYISGTAETVIKSCVGNVGLSINNSILGLLVFFPPRNVTLLCLFIYCAYLFIVMPHFCKYLTYLLGFLDGSEGKELVR